MKIVLIHFKIQTSHRTCEFKHIMFGRIQGMSTRKGTAVFLSDILEEATQRSESSQIWVFKKNFKRKKHWYLLKNKLFSTRCRKTRAKSLLFSLIYIRV